MKKRVVTLASHITIIDVDDEAHVAEHFNVDKAQIVFVDTAAVIRAAYLYVTCVRCLRA